jgi:hypothetical protein
MTRYLSDCHYEERSFTGHCEERSDAAISCPLRTWREIAASLRSSQ